MIKKYHIHSKILHWAMAIIIILLLIVGIFMANFLPSEASYKYQIYDLHKSFGVIAFIFLLMRVLNRFIHQPPPLPNSIPKHEIFLSHFVHFAIYFLMLAMPVSGYLMSSFYGFPVHLFSLELPIFVENNPVFGSLAAKFHKYFSYSLIAFLCLHILGVIKHRFFDKNKENDVLKRMI